MEEEKTKAKQPFLLEKFTEENGWTLVARFPTYDEALTRLKERARVANEREEPPVPERVVKKMAEVDFKVY